MMDGGVQTNEVMRASAAAQTDMARVRNVRLQTKLNMLAIDKFAEKSSYC